VPSVLKVIERNLRHGQKNLRLFEVGTTFAHVPHDNARNSSQSGSQSGLDGKVFIPSFRERQELIIALTGAAGLEEAGSKNWSGSERSVDFYDIKGVLEALAVQLGIVLGVEGASIQPCGAFGTVPPPLFSPNTVELRMGAPAAKPDANAGAASVIAYAGEVSKSALKAFEISSAAAVTPVFLCVVNLWALPQFAAKQRKYSLVSPYPTVMRDLAFVVNASVEAGAVLALIRKEAGEFMRSAEIFDVFTGAEGKSVGAGKKSLAFALHYNSPEKTLADADVETSIQRIVKSAETAFGAVLRS
jgi:phenylalanyl-tRNA synthetase beta chain